MAARAEDSAARRMTVAEAWLAKQRAVVAPGSGGVFGAAPGPEAVIAGGGLTEPAPSPPMIDDGGRGAAVGAVAGPERVISVPGRGGAGLPMVGPSAGPEPVIAASGPGAVCDAVVGPEQVISVRPQGWGSAGPPAIEFSAGPQLLINASGPGAVRDAVARPAPMISGAADTGTEVERADDAPGRAPAPRQRVIGGWGPGPAGGSATTRPRTAITEVTGAGDGEGRDGEGRDGEAGEDDGGASRRGPAAAAQLLIPISGPGAAAAGAERLIAVPGQGAAVIAVPRPGPVIMEGSGREDGPRPSSLIGRWGPVTAPTAAERPEAPITRAPAGPRPGIRPPARPRIEPEPAILGLSRHTRSRLGSRLFNLFFAFVFALIVIQMVVALLTP